MSKRNENRPGYKETRVGWIPREWSSEKFNSLSNIGPQNGLYKKPNEYANDGVRMVHMPQLFANDHIQDQPMPKVILSEKEKKSYILSDGDLLFGRRSLAVEGSGKCSIVEKPSSLLTFESSIIRISPNKKRLYPTFAFHYIGSPLGRYQMFTITRVVAVSGITGSDLKLYRLPIPPLPEQKKIAQILSTWDKAIEQTRKLIEAKKQLKKGLMQQLLTGRMRFPQFGPPAKKGKLPEWWRYCRLGDCFEERKENNINLPLLSITGDRGVIPRDEVERKDTSNIDKSKYKRIVPGDIGYNTMRMWQGNSALSYLEGIVSPAYTVCKPKNGQAPEFYKHLFKFKPIIHLFYRYSQGLVSDTWNLKFHHFAMIKVAVPDRSEQIIIANLLNTIDLKVLALKKKLSALEKQKKGLMQKLLTGEIRVQIPN